MKFSQFLPTLIFLHLAGVVESRAQATSGVESTLLVQQIEEALQQSRAGSRNLTARFLQDLAEEALRSEDREAWAWAQTGLAEQALLAAEEGEWIAAEPVKILSEVIQQCGEAGITGPLARAWAARAACLLALDQPVAAAQAWERAGSLALDANLVNPAIQSFLRAARIYRSEGHAARVRASQSWLDALVAQHPVGVTATSRQAIAAFTASARRLLALTTPPEAVPALLTLQPLLTEISVSSDEKELGRSRFTLSNFTTQAVLGNLRLSAQHGQLAVWSAEDGTLHLTLRPQEAPTPFQRPIRLLPGEKLKIFIDYRFMGSNQGFEDTVELTWGAETAVAHFHFVAGPAARSQVINASRVTQPRGWPEPFYHEIYYRGQVLQVEDVLAETSSPARVEIYNEDTGVLLAIDAEGDGSYDGPDDYLPATHDRDADARPDLVVGPENPVGSLEIYVFPIAPVDPSTKLTLSLADYSRTPARWRVDSRDEQLP